MLRLQSGQVHRNDHLNAVSVMSLLHSLADTVLDLTEELSVLNLEQQDISFSLCSLSEIFILQAQTHTATVRATSHLENSRSFLYIMRHYAIHLSATGGYYGPLTISSTKVLQIFIDLLEEFSPKERRRMP